MPTKRITTRKKTTTMTEPVTASDMHEFVSRKDQLRDMYNSMNWMPLIVIILIVAAFFLGMLVTKVQYLSGTSGSSMSANNYPTQAPAQAGATAGAAVAPLHVAKAIGMDVQKFNSCLESGKYKQKVLDDNAYAQKVGVQATPANFINGNLLLGAVPYDTIKTTLDQELANPNGPLPTGTRVQLDNGDFPALGDPNAPVTYEEFADFQCPFCERFFTDSEPKLIADYVKTGKVKFIFRNFAFLGPDSNTAAEGAYCANDQGKFWEYHNFLYSHQGAEGSGQFSVKNLE